MVCCLMAQHNYSESCLALRSICASVETLLGPNKSLKCYISSEGDSAILGDTLQVLDALMASYRPHTHALISSAPPPHRNAPPPALRLLHECCREHQTRVGCGLTTLVCLTGYWATEILELVHQELPVPVIFAVFRECLYKSRKHFSAHLLQLPRRTAPPTSAQRRSEARRSSSGRPRGHAWASALKATHSREVKMVLTFSRHFWQNAGSRHASGGGARDDDAEAPPSSSDGTSSEGTGSSEDVRCGGEHESDQLLNFVSERLSRGRGLAMRLAREATILQREGSVSLLDKPLWVPLQYCVVGKSEEHSKVLRGVVTSIHSDMVTLARQKDSKLRIVLVGGDCTPHSSHLGLQKRAGHVMSRDLSQLHEESNTTVWLNQVTAVIKKFDINVLIVDGIVWPPLWQQCIGLDVMVIKEVPHPVAKALAELCGVTPLSYLTQCSTESVGVGVAMEVLESGWPAHKPSAAAAAGNVSSKAFCCRLYKDSPTSPGDRGVLSTSPPVVTAMLCSLTEYRLDTLRHQFANCYHRLHWAIKGLTVGDAGSTPTSTTSREVGATFHLLRGEGCAEAACIRMLEADDLSSESGGRSSLPLYFSSSWMSDSTYLQGNLWKQSVYQAFANGLRRYLTRCVLNAEPGLGTFKAMSKVEGMVRSGGEVVGTKVMDEGSKVMDVAESKWQAWKGTVQLLETVFLSASIKLSHSLLQSTKCI